MLSCAFSRFFFFFFYSLPFLTAHSLNSFVELTVSPEKGGVLGGKHTQTGGKKKVNKPTPAWWLYTHRSTTTMLCVVHYRQYVFGERVFTNFDSWRAFLYGTRFQEPREVDGGSAKQQLRLVFWSTATEKSS